MTQKRVSKDRIDKEASTSVRPSSKERLDLAAGPPSRREQILSAAVRVFSTRGYRETLVDEIAHEAGVAKGTLYLYFQSKEEMYLEAFRENIEQLHALSVARMDEASSTWDKIKALVAVRLELGETHKDFLRIYLAEFAGSFTGQGEWYERLRSLVRRDSDLLKGVFLKGIKNGEVRALPVEQLVATFQYVMGGLMASRVVKLRLSDIEPDPDLIIDLLRKGLGPPEI